MKHFWLFAVILLSYAHSSEVYEIQDVENNKKGSGFFIKKDTVVTNAHVCISNYEEFVRGEKPKTPSEMVVLKQLKRLTSKSFAVLLKTDLCVIKVEEQDSFLVAEYNYQFKPYEILYLPNKKGELTRLVYKFADTQDDLWTKLHPNSHIASGYGEKGQSGSPILNINRKVVGVMWGSGNYSNDIFFLKIDDIKELLDL